MKSKGFTIIELMIVVAIIGIMAAVLGGAIGTGGGQNKSSAERAAREFAGNMYHLKNLNVSCTNMQDKNGFVSCTVIGTDPYNKEVERYLDCAGAITLNQGCRPTRLVIQNISPSTNEEGK